MRDEISYTEYQREVYDHERQTGQHAFECDPDESAGLAEHYAEARAIEDHQERKHRAREAAKETLATYTIQILSPDLTPEEARWSLADQRVLSNLPAMIESVEEDLTDLLPEGYEARITEWSEE